MWGGGVGYTMTDHVGNPLPEEALARSNTISEKRNNTD